MQAIHKNLHTLSIFFENTKTSISTKIHHITDFVKKKFFDFCAAIEGNKTAAFLLFTNELNSSNISKTSFAINNSFTHAHSYFHRKLSVLIFNALHHPVSPLSIPEYKSALSTLFPFFTRFIADEPTAYKMHPLVLLNTLTLPDKNEHKWIESYISALTEPTPKIICDWEKINKREIEDFFQDHIRDLPTFFPLVIQALNLPKTAQTTLFLSCFFEALDKKSPNTIYKISPESLLNILTHHNNENKTSINKFVSYLTGTSAKIECDISLLPKDKLKELKVLPYPELVVKAKMQLLKLAIDEGDFAEIIKFDTSYLQAYINLPEKGLHHLDFSFTNALNNIKDESFQKFIIWYIHALHDCKNSTPKEVDPKTILDLLALPENKDSPWKDKLISCIVDEPAKIVCKLADDFRDNIQELVKLPYPRLVNWAARQIILESKDPKRQWKVLSSLEDSLFKDVINSFSPEELSGVRVNFDITIPLEKKLALLSLQLRYAAENREGLDRLSAPFYAIDGLLTLYTSVMENQTGKPDLDSCTLVINTVLDACSSNLLMMHILYQSYSRSKSVFMTGFWDYREKYQLNNPCCEIFHLYKTAKNKNDLLNLYDKTKKLIHPFPSEDRGDWFMEIFNCAFTNFVWDLPTLLLALQHPNETPLMQYMKSVNEKDTNYLHYDTQKLLDAWPKSHTYKLLSILHALYEHETNPVIKQRIKMAINIITPSCISTSKKELELCYDTSLSDPEILIIEK